MVIVGSPSGADAAEEKANNVLWRNKILELNKGKLLWAIASEDREMSCTSEEGDEFGDPDKRPRV